MHRRGLIVGCALIAVLLAGVVARAQQPKGAANPAAAKGGAAKSSAAARARAAKHFDDGARGFNSGAFGAARTEFEKAYALTHAWQMLFYIGICQSRELRYLEAIATLERYLSVGAARVPAKRRTQAQLELKSLRALLAHITVRVDVAGAEVRVDERVVGRSPLRAPVALAPHGRTQTISARKRGYRVAKRRLTVAAGDRRTIALALERQRGVLVLDSVPPGAQARIDGDAVGATPLRRWLVVGSHGVALSAPGYLPQRKRVVMIGEQPYALTLHLRPLPPTPWYKRWYVWTAVGAAIVGGIVAGLVVHARACPEDVCTGLLVGDGR